jgi:2-C-methyl-D-erythritol 4-phosphate cytidylyltransferase
VQLLIDECRHDEVGGILAWPLSDTLKQSQGDRIEQTLERQNKWMAQTPQMFKLDALIQAIESGSSLMTDESSAMEAQGFAPKLVKASALNIKVTYAEDFLLAKALLAANEQFHPASTDQRPQP